MRGKYGEIRNGRGKSNFFFKARVKSNNKPKLRGIFDHFPFSESGRPLLI